MRLRRASISSSILMVALGAASLVSAAQTSQDVGRAPPIPEAGVNPKRRLVVQGPLGEEPNGKWRKSGEHREILQGRETSQKT